MGFWGLGVLGFRVLGFRVLGFRVSAAISGLGGLGAYRALDGLRV